MQNADGKLPFADGIERGERHVKIHWRGSPLLGLVVLGYCRLRFEMWRVYRRRQRAFIVLEAQGPTLPA